MLNTLKNKTKDTYMLPYLFIIFDVVLVFTMCIIDLKETVKKLLEFIKNYGAHIWRL